MLTGSLIPLAAMQGLPGLMLAPLSTGAGLQQVRVWQPGCRWEVCLAQSLQSSVYSEQTRKPCKVIEAVFRAGWPQHPAFFCSTMLFCFAGVQVNVRAASVMVDPLG